MNEIPFRRIIGPHSVADGPGSDPHAITHILENFDNASILKAQFFARRHAHEIQHESRP
ncbi:hypothetical protein [Castellaniella sp. UC4442_H9]